MRSYEIHLTNKYGIRQTVYISMEEETALEQAQKYCANEGSTFRKLVVRPLFLSAV